MIELRNLFDEPERLHRINLLPSPFLPQMTDDGLITSSDLQNTNAIIIEIRPYDHAAKGDFIFLYFQGQNSPVFNYIEDSLNDFPFIFSINADSIPDGIYKVQYTVADSAGNFSHSQVTDAIILRNGTGAMPFPIFSDAKEGIISRDNILSEGGAHVFIPAYPLAVEGDQIILVFWVKNADNNDISNSAYSQNHLLSMEEISSGFTVLVPERYLLLVNQGYAFASYTVFRSNGQMDNAAVASVEINLDDEELLPVSYFVDSTFGELTAGEVKNGIRVGVSYNDMSVGDMVSISLRGTDTQGIPIVGAESNQNFTLSETQVNDGEAIVTLSESLAERGNNGWLNSDYTVTRMENGIPVIRISSLGMVMLNMEGSVLLPPPVFISAVDGILDFSIVEDENGTLLRIASSSLLPGDIVTIYLSGYNASGEFVSEASEQHIHTVTPAELVQGYLVEELSSAAVLSVGDKGTLQSYYTAQSNLLADNQQ